jgi:hypothetical protein
MTAVGLLGALAVLVWILRRHRRRAIGADRRRWQRLRSMSALTMPFLHDRRRVGYGRVGALRGNARLVFVHVQDASIVIDGLIATVPDSVRQPFWLRVRRPTTEWMSTTLESMMAEWAAAGEPVEVETRPSRDGCQATLTVGRSRIVLDVEGVGGLVDAA